MIIIAHLMQKSISFFGILKANSEVKPGRQGQIVFHRCLSCPASALRAGLAIIQANMIERAPVQ